MHSGQSPDYDYLTLLYDLLLKSLKDQSQFASEKTLGLFEQYIAEASNQGLNTSPLNTAFNALKSLCRTSSTQSVTSSTNAQTNIINILCDFHRKKIEKALSIGPATSEPSLLTWMVSLATTINIFEKPSTPPPANSISDDILIFIIALQLQLPELANFVQTSKKFWTLFQPRLLERSPLFYVMKADEIAANTSLFQLKTINADNWADNWQCVLKRIPGKEPCGRKWNSVSPLEYAAWIGDMFMVEMLLTHVPTEGLQQALDQLLAVKNHGLEHGPRMAPFIALLDAYEYYEKNFYQFNNHDERGKYCVAVIGGLQRQLSSFGLQWFCDNEPFHPVPNFDRAPQRSFMMTGKSWDPYTAELGVSCFIYKVNADSILTKKEIEHWGSFWPVHLKYLCQVSGKQFDSIITQLQAGIAQRDEAQLKK